MLFWKTFPFFRVLVRKTASQSSKNWSRNAVKVFSWNAWKDWIDDIVKHLTLIDIEKLKELITNCKSCSEDCHCRGTMRGSRSCFGTESPNWEKVERDIADKTSWISASTLSRARYVSNSCGCRLNRLLRSVRKESLSSSNMLLGSEGSQCARVMTNSSLSGWNEERIGSGKSRFHSALSERRPRRKQISR